MRAELFAALGAFLVSACGDLSVVNVGAERRLTITTATPLADGRWRQAGFRVTEADTDADARLWYGTTRADGTLPTIVTLPEDGPSALRASAALASTWVVAGYVTGANGQPVAWVRGLDDGNEERWTTTLPSPDGFPTEATALATTNEGTLVVAGFEQVSAGERQGWVALLDANGMARWRHGFRTGFQRQARGVVPWAVATQDGPASMSRRQFWLAGTRTFATGETRGYALQLTLDGELWDSDPLGVAGSVSRGVVAAGSEGLVVCTSLDGAAELAWTQGGAVSGAATTVVRREAPFTLIGCLGTPTHVTLFGQTEREGAPVPTVITVERASRSAVDGAEWTSARGASVFGGTVDSAGALELLGRTPAPLRRWSAHAP